MPDYPFAPDQLPAFKRLLLKQYVLNVAVPFAGFGFTYSYFIRQYSLTFSLLITLLGIATLAVGYLLAASQQTKAALGYQLTTNAEGITRRLPNAMPMTMQFGDVDRVTTDANGNGLLLKSSRTKQLLAISPDVMGYSQLLSELRTAIPDFHISAPTFAEKAMRYRSLIISGLFLLPFLLIKLTH